MAIYSLHHSHVGKSTQAQAGTAGAHVRYITRAGAASLVMAEHMPSGPDAARSWIDERELTDRKNGRVIDKLMLALPVELDGAGRADLVREFMHEIGGGRVSWMAGIHDRGKDEHNPHAHIILRDKDLDTGKRVIGTSEKGSTDRIREVWEIAANRALERAGLDVRIDRRSLADQALDREPGIHVGPNVAAMEDRGIRPVSIPQEVANDRVVNWPEIDQGRTRADRQREIEAGNLERDRERDRDKSGDRSAGLAPAVEITPEPEPPYVPNFVLVPDAPEIPQPAPQIDQLDAKPEPEPPYVPNFVLVRDAPEVQPTPEGPQAASREAQAPMPEMGGIDLPGALPEAIQRPSYEVAPEPQTPKRDRLAEFVASAREKLAGLADRLEAAFDRIRERHASPAPPVQPRREELRPTPATPRPRNPLDDLAEIGRSQARPSRKPEPEPDRDRSIWDEFMKGPRMKGPGGPGL